MRMKSLWRYGRFLQPDMGIIAVMLLRLFGGTGVGLAIPALTGQMAGHIKSALAPNSGAAGVAAWRAVPFLGLELVAAAATTGLLGFIRGYLSEWIAQRGMFRARGAIYDHLQAQSFDYFDQNETGQILSRATGDVETLRRLVSRAGPGAVAAAAQFVGTAVILFNANVTLALLTLAIAPFFVMTVLGLSRRVRPASWAVQQQLADLTSVLQEDVAAIRVIKAFARSDHEEARFDAENRAYYDRTMDVARIQARYQPILSQLPTLGTVLLLGVGGSEVLAGHLTFSMFVAFNGYVLMLLGPLRMVGLVVNLGAQAAASAERIFEVLDGRGQVHQPPDARILPRLQGEVRFEHVYARYRDAGDWTLEDIDLTVAPGERVALVGITGAGKSTLVQLVPRFYDPVQGTVRVDGHDLRELDLQSLRQQIGFVLQDPFLFSASIADNIRYGRPDADRAAVAAAARAAHIADFIETLPSGYDTVVGERGVGLSGGQKQRVAIARALLLDPRILILDDATSSVDAENEYLIRQALQRLMAGRTSLIIAHRLAGVMFADRIAVLEGGRVAAVGTHAELLETSGLYRRIYELQLAPEGMQPGGVGA
jgi:ATP-binding cassette subfamily B protein